MKDEILELLTSVKAAASVATYTTLSGVAWGLQWVNGNLATIATVSGIGLTWTLIYTHWKKGSLERELTKLQINEISERIQHAIVDRNQP